MINYTALLHLLMGIFGLCTALYFGVRYAKWFNPYAKKLGWFFFFLSAYTLSLSIPFYIFEDIQFASIGFLAGWTFVQFTILSGLTITAKGLPHTLPHVQNIMRWALFMSGFVFIGYLALNLPTPTLLPNGFVLWNIPFYAALGLGGTTLIAGTFWSYLHYRTWGITPQEEKLTRAKLLLLAADGVAWGTAAFIYVTVNNMVGITIAFVLMILSLFVTALFMWLSRYLENA